MQNKSVVVIARLIAKPGQEDRVKYTLAALIAPTRKEIGCLSYNFYQSSYDNRVFMSHEIWANHEAFANHLKTPYIVALQEMGADSLVQPLEVTFMDSLG